MEVIDAICSRRSVKKYKSDPVPTDLLEKILEAGTFAPTGMNRQSPVIVAVTDKQQRDKLSKMNAAVLGAGNDPFYGAPVVVVVLADRNVPTYLYDGSLVMGNLMNAAHSLGIGSCWIHRAKEVFDSEEGKELLREWGLEGNYEGIGNCILGYAACEPAERGPRKEGYTRIIK